MVLGKAYKENLVLIWFIYIFLLIAAISGIILISIFVEKLLTKILLFVLISMFILLITYLPYYAYKCKRIPEDIIKYNVIEETIAIYGYKKKYEIKITDIAFITVHNWGNRMLFPNRIEEGKLGFYLKDGSKIKTEEINNVYDVYNKIDDIVFKDREDEAILKEQVIDKLDGWGSKREYPSIVSVLVALFLPFVGVFFVKNQFEYKELKNGKPTGVMAIALIISALWVFAVVIVIALL